MKSKTLIDQIQYEAKLAQGDETKNVSYVSQNTLPNDLAAREAFDRSVKKLLDVNAWSNLSSLTADFQVYDPAGQPKTGSPQPNDYIKVVLPGPVPENWVRVTHSSLDENKAEFTVQPSHKPGETEADEVAHFFRSEARSTFRVELSGTTITASEIGQQESVNNQQPQAGDRAIINTVIAETGWLFYQQFQWKLLTDYLVDL
jgi:hypothetical protein